MEAFTTRFKALIAEISDFDLVWVAIGGIGLLVVLLVLLLIRYLIKRSRSEKSAQSVPFPHLRDQNALSQNFRDQVTLLDDNAKGNVRDDKSSQDSSTDSDLSTRKVSSVTGGLRTSFRKTLSLLRTNYPGSDYRYKTPWYLMVGESSCGKSTLLNHAGLHLPFGEPEEIRTGIKQKCTWWFFDKGIVLDVLGDFILKSDEESSNDRGWRSLLRLLQKYRMKRPIDGVVLTIPCTDLIGPAKEKEERMARIHRKAEVLAQKLWTAQKILGLRFPVYVMVTKCDEIAGFQSFCAEIPDHLYNNMFGWSNPYNVDTVYSNDWIEESFNNIYRDLSRTQTEVIADGIQVADTDSFFLFPSLFATLQESLRIYLNYIFKESTYREPFAFRGIYFSGHHNSEQTAAADMSEENEADTPMDEMIGEGNTLKPKAKTPIFVRHFLEQKVFSEQGLTRPVLGTFISENRRIRAAQAAVLAFLIIIGGGTWWATERISREQGTVSTVLEGIANDISQIKDQNVDTSSLALFKQLKGDSGSSPFKEYALHLIQGMTNISTNDLNSVFLPSSYFDSVKGNILGALTLAYDAVILESMFVELNRKAKKVLEDTPTTILAEFPKNSPELTQQADFVALQTLVDDWNALESNAALYNGLKESDSLQDLGKVVKYLYAFDLPPNFYTDAGYYHAALKNSRYRTFQTEIFGFKARIQVRRLSSSFYEQFMTNNILLTNAQSLATDIDQFPLEPWGTPELNQFQTLQEQIGQFEDLLESDQVSWLQQREWNLGGDFTAVMDQIEKTRFLGRDLRNEVETNGRSRFDKLREGLAEVDSRLIGPILTVQQDLLSEAQSAFKGIKASQLIRQGRRVRQVVKNPKSITRVAEQEVRRQEAAAKRNAGSEESVIPTNIASDPIQVAEPLLTLETALDNFLNQRFVTDEPTQKLTTQLVEGSRLRWDEERLKRAIETTIPYQDFEESGLPNFPVSFRNTLRQVALQRLQTRMLGLLAEAQTFEPETNAGTPTMVEASLEQNINEFKEVSDTLAQLLNVLDQLDLVRIQTQLEDLVVAQAYDLLSTVDNILEADPLYVVASQSFSNWNGEEVLTKALFGIDETAELRPYLDAQRTRMHDLANHFAAPVLGVLGDPQMSAGVNSSALVIKWQNILSELSQYDQKNPNNSIILLEDFILVGMDQITLPNCFDSTKPKQSSGFNFFQRREQQLLRQIRRRCGELANSEAQEIFNDTVTFFDQTTEDLNAPVPQRPPIPDDTLPVELPEFRALSAFTKSLQTPEENLDIFRQLSSVEGGENLEPFNPLIFQEEAQADFRILWNRWERVAFDENPFLRELQRLSNKMNAWTQQRNPTSQDVNRLRNILDSINRIESNLQNPSLSWIFAQQLDLGNKFNDLLNSVKDSSYLGESVQNQSSDLVQAAFRRLKDKIQSQRSELTGALLVTGSQNPFLIAPKTKAFQNVVTDFLAQPFMVDQTDRNFKTIAPTNTVMQWVPQILEETVTLLDPYEQFLSAQFSAVPINVQNKFKTLALNRFHRNLVVRIADAQNFVPVAEPFQRLGIERNLQSDIQNFQNSAKPVGQLLSIFRQLQFNTSYQNLFDLVVPQANRLLVATDRFLVNGQLYLVSAQNFQVWDGKKSPWLVFGASDEKQIGAYLETQRERVRVLANQYAKPLIDFLTTRDTPPASLNVALINRWQQILKSFEQFDNKQPGNAISAMDNFVKTELSQLNVANCLSELVPPPAGSDNYFREQLRQMVQDFRSRCLELVNSEALSQYAAFKQTFDTTVFGQFPFADVSAGKTVADLSPSDLRDFFTAFDAYQEQGRPLLEQSTKYRVSKIRVLAFLDQLKEVRTFFAPFLDNGSGDPPVFDLDVEFRANQSQEVGGNQIIAWELSFGETKIQDSQPETQGRWAYQTPMKLSLRWAKDSPYLPVPEETKRMTIEDGQVVYNYPQQWALLELLQKQAAVFTDFSSPTDSEPQTLKFEISTFLQESEVVPGEKLENDLKVKVFIRVKVWSPDRKKQLVFRPFPTSAPRLEP